MNLDQIRLATKIAKAIGVTGGDSMDDASGTLQSARKQMTARALGLQELLTKSTSGQDYRNDLAAAQKENAASEEGNGAAGFVGSLAGDPLSYVGGSIGQGPALEAKLASKLTPKAVKLAQLITGGAVTGGLSGLTEGTQDPNSTLVDNAENSVIGAGIGTGISLGIPAVAGTANIGKNIATGVYDRAASAMGSKEAPIRIANNIYAKYLNGNNVSPAEAKSAIQAVTDSPLNPTLGEMTQSPKILGVEKNISKGDDVASQDLNSFFTKRADEVIPQAFKDIAKPLQETGKTAGGLYTKAYLETPSPESQQTMFNDMQSVKQKITDRLAEKGDVNDIETRALKNAQTSILNSERRGNTIPALHDARQELQNMVIDGAEPGMAKKASSYANNYRKTIGQNLDNMAPENFAAADSAHMQGLAGNELTDAVNTSREGGLRQMYNKMFATPEQQADFIRKVPESDRPQFEQFFDELKKVSRGHADSGTAYNIVSNQNLANDTRGFDSGITQFLPNLLDKATGSYTAPIREAMSGLSQNPTNSIYDAMVKRARSVLDNPNLSKGISLATLKTDQPTEKADSPVFEDHEALPDGFSIQPQHEDLPPGFVIKGAK